MIDAISWVMTNPRKNPHMRRYLLLNHVLVVIDYEEGVSRVVAQAFDAQTKAHDVALDQTRAMEGVGYRLDGYVVEIATRLSPWKIADKYRVRQPIGPGLNTLLERLQRGHGEPL